MKLHRFIPPVLTATVTFTAAFAQMPTKTRQDILNYGVTAIGSPYVWGGGNWDPDNRAFGGADCSGFVSKCWSIDRWTPYRVDRHGPSTYNYIRPDSRWSEVDRADLLYGDAICYRYNNDQSGHIYLYLSGDGWGDHEVYEARGTDYGIVHRWRTVYSAAEVTKGLRRVPLLENVGVTEHIVETDDGAPAYVDTGMTGSSQYDSYALGCTEGDCRYRWVTTDRTQTCTYRPDLPEAGWYRVYVTCNESSPNVHDVGVTVNHAHGSVRFLWDQADPAGLNQWVPVGDQSFYFAAGTAGTVVWDNTQAWPTDGNHVFRGDATKFVLDNRVEVDGVGGSPGRFATLRDALAWLKTHESEEPNIINVTCDTLVETGVIVVDAWDDVTLNGDADGNGVPVTVVVSPGVPADFSSSCGLYLDIPIQHHYTLRDLVLVPAFVAAGHNTGAYGLVIDEQNPTAQAGAWTLTLENVTVAGSLPGHVATVAGLNQRAAATMFGSTQANSGAAVLQRSSASPGDASGRQTVTATHLTITHSASRGLAVESAYTDWLIDGGLVVTYCGQEGIKTYNADSSTLTVRRSGGAAANRIGENLGRALVNLGGGSVVLGSCVLDGNHGADGGAVYSASATTELRDCWIVNNTATGSGGGVYAGGGTLTLGECTVANNSAGTTGGVHVSGVMANITNSIVWGNSGAQISGGVNVTFSTVEGGYAGEGNFSLDPVFVNAAAGDFHLPRWSPCINAGNPAFVAAAGRTDIDGEPRVQAGFVDVGADEQFFWAGDADGDGDVELDDYASFAACMAGPEASPPAPGFDCLVVFDYDDDGDVDLADFRWFRLREAGDPVTPVPDLVVESRDATGAVTPPPAYAEDGAWANSTIKSTVPGLTGTGSRFITYDLPNAGTDNATFVPYVVTPGVYEVFVTWDIGANCYDAQYTIRHAEGQAVLLVDQIPDGLEGANANTWVSLGQYRFAAGQDAATGSVNVSEATVSGKPHSGWNQRVYADAAKWVFVAP
jgi:hypothetical protein